MSQPGSDTDPTHWSSLDFASFASTLVITFQVTLPVKQSCWASTSHWQLASYKLCLHHRQALFWFRACPLSSLLILAIISCPQKLEGILEIIWFNLTCLMDWGGWGPETCHLPKVTQLICCWIRALVGVLSSCCCSVAQSSPDLWDPMDGSTPGFPVHHQLPEFTQTHVHWVSDTIQPTHSLSLPSLPAFNLLQLLGLFQWADSSHQVAKILELQLQHQSFQWIFRTDFL